MRRRSRRWRACACGACCRSRRWRARAVAGAAPRGPRVVACARRGCWIRRCSAPRGRAQRADDARALLLGGGREALISRGVRHFGNAYVYFFAPLILRCVASPYDGPTGNLSPGRRRRARSMFDGAARRARGGVPSLVGGAAPLPARKRQPSPAGERDALPSWHSSPRVLDTPEQRATMTS